MIQESATYVLKHQSITNEMEHSSDAEPKPSKELLMRLSFTRRVSKEVVDRHHSLGGLTDVSWPILVPETDEN